jgi:hypothetical protein
MMLFVARKRHSCLFLAIGFFEFAAVLVDLRRGL